jgi:hypothetical protein
MYFFKNYTSDTVFEANLLYFKNYKSDMQWSVGDRPVSPHFTVVSKSFEDLEEVAKITMNISWRAPMNGFFKVN